MADFPYILVTGSLKRFFGHIQSAGVPTKVVTSYLLKVGFKSTNDRPIISVLKFIGFINGEGTPTDRWIAYRNRTEAGRVMAEAVRVAYSDLFATFPDADRKDNEALRNYFSAHSKVGEKALGAIVGTFKTLCELADFEPNSSASVPPPAESPEDHGAAVSPTQMIPPQVPATAPTININIQLELPATEDAAIYEKLFSAMRKHLFQK